MGPTERGSGPGPASRWVDVGSFLRGEALKGVKLYYWPTGAELRRPLRQPVRPLQSASSSSPIFPAAPRFGGGAVRGHHVGGDHLRDSHLQALAAVPPQRQWWISTGRQRRLPPLLPRRRQVSQSVEPQPIISPTLRRCMVLIRVRTGVSAGLRSYTAGRRMWGSESLMPTAGVGRALMPSSSRNGLLFLPPDSGPISVLLAVVSIIFKLGFYGDPSQRGDRDRGQELQWIRGGRQRWHLGLRGGQAWRKGSACRSGTCTPPFLFLLALPHPSHPHSFYLLLPVLLSWLIMIRGSSTAVPLLRFFLIIARALLICFALVNALQKHCLQRGFPCGGLRIRVILGVWNTLVGSFSEKNKLSHALAAIFNSVFCVCFLLHIMVCASESPLGEMVLMRIEYPCSFYGAV